MRTSPPSDLNATQPLSGFALETVCDVLADELERDLARQHALAAPEPSAALGDLAEEPQPDGALVERPGR